VVKIKQNQFWRAGKS